MRNGKMTGMPALSLLVPINRILLTSDIVVTLVFFIEYLYLDNDSVLSGIDSLTSIWNYENT